MDGNPHTPKFWSGLAWPGLVWSGALPTEPPGQLSWLDLELDHDNVTCERSDVLGVTCEGGDKVLGVTCERGDNVLGVTWSTGADSSNG